MGRIVMSENVSLDGVVQDPAGDEGFRVGGWVGKIQDRDDLYKATLDEALGAEALLLGRRSYEWLAARWPSRSGELADRLNSLPKYVVSSTLEHPEWNNSTVLNGNVAKEVLKLKQELDGEIVVPASFRPFRHDQRQETYAPRRHPDPRRRRRIPHLQVRSRRLRRHSSPPIRLGRVGPLRTQYVPIQSVWAASFTCRSVRA